MHTRSISFVKRRFIDTDLSRLLTIFHLDGGEMKKALTPEGIKKGALFDEK